MKAFDAHCDTAMALLMEGRQLDHNDLHISLDRAKKLDGYAQFFGHFTSMAGRDSGGKAPPEADRFMLATTPETMFRDMYSGLIAEIDRCADQITLCRTGAEGETAIAQGKVAAFVSIEGAEAIGCDPGRLEEAYAMGVRLIAPTWNFDNPLSGTNKTGGGLTRQGREFVRRAQELGMLIDVSHISERAFWDICDITSGPVVASHSNSKAITAHSRNLTDAQFREIIQTGGFAGINLCAEFLGAAPVTLDDVCRHALHFLELGGEKALALGADFDGCDVLPQGISGVDDYTKIYQALQKAGVPQALADDIFFNNIMEVVKQVCDM